MNNYREAKAKDSDLKLTVYIHGGLNTFNQTIKRVNKTKKLMQEDNRYPIYISWKSGPFTNYFDHLFSLRNGERKGALLGGLSSPFILAEDTLRSLIRTPFSTYNVLFGQNTTAISVLSKDEIYNDRAIINLHEKGFDVIEDPNKTGHSIKHFWTFINPLKIITAPFIDGLGTGSWQSMLRRTDLVLRKSTIAEGVTANSSKSAASMLFDKLTDIEGQEKEPITLIAHSMGTIIANNIISSYGKLNFDEIIYMASACSLKDIQATVAPYLEQNTKTHMYMLSLSPYREMMENNALDFIPRGSLLMWIDDTLGEVNSFQDKTAGFWFNITSGADAIFDNVSHKERIHLTKFGIADETPQKHGDFGSYPYWREDFWLNKKTERIKY